MRKLVNVPKMLGFYFVFLLKKTTLINPFTADTFLYMHNILSTIHFILICQTLFADYFFYHLLFLAETNMIWLNLFYVVRNKISVGSDNVIEFPQKLAML